MFLQNVCRRSVNAKNDLILAPKARHFFRSFHDIYKFFEDLQVFSGTNFYLQVFIYKFSEMKYLTMLSAVGVQ